MRKEKYSLNIIGEQKQKILNKIPRNEYNSTLQGSYTMIKGDLS